MSRSARLLAVAAMVMATVVTRPVFGQDADAARTLVERAAEALGGLERIRNIRHITLFGYGQYLYQFGGGNITSSPYAPLK